jgi:hypothetical protein
VLKLTFDKMPEQTARKASFVELGIARADQLAIVDMLVRAGIGDRLSEFQWDRDDDWLTASDGRTTVSTNQRSGGMQYRLRPLDEEPGTDVGTSETALKDIARVFVDMIGRPSGSMGVEEITYLRTLTGSSDDETTVEGKLDAGVIFNRTVNDIPVIGPGGMVMVKIGTDDAIVGGWEVLRPILGGGAPMTLRTPDEAVALLQRQLDKLGLEGEACVREARFGYFEMGIDESQRLLEPCYLFIVETVGRRQDFRKGELVPAARIGPMAAAFAAG